LPEVKKAGKLALLSKDRHEFLSHLEIALKKDNYVTRQKRIAFARKNTWEDRLFELENAIKKYIFPKVSVIITTYNTAKYTRLCIESVFNNSNWPNLEVIVVDNGSIDGTGALLKHYQKKYSSLNVISLNSNRGFAAGNNMGMKEASGEYIVLLNSDTIVTKDWMRDLIAHLANRKIGLVGPVTNAIGNEAKIETSYKSLRGIDSFALKNHMQNQGKAFEITKLAFFCVAARQAVWKKIGKLDERFELGTFEDDDYCLRVKQAGYKLLCAEDVFIHHFLGKTREKIELMDQIFESNKLKFEKKWGAVWIPHRYAAGRPAEN